MKLSKPVSDELAPWTTHLNHWPCENRALVFCSLRQQLFVLDALSYQLFLGQLEGETSLVQKKMLSVLPGFDECEINRALANVASLFDAKSEIGARPFLQETPMIPWPSSPKQESFISLTFKNETIGVSMPACLISQLSSVFDLVKSTVKVEAIQIKTFNSLKTQLVVCDSESPTSNCGASDNILYDPSYEMGDQLGCQFRGVTKQQLASYLLVRAFRQYCLNTDYSFIFHGAAVFYQGINWLFPAASGAGKSTLMYHLLQRGAYVYSDDAMVLDAEYRPIATFMPLCVKQGMWQDLKLADDQIFERLDGRKFIYHQPIDPPYAPIDAMRSAPRVVISPLFLSKTAFSVSSMPLDEAMTTLCDLGYRQRLQQQGEPVISLINVINQLPRFKASYSECNSHSHPLINWMDGYAQSN